MIDVPVVLSVLALYSVAVVVPGPSFVAVCHRALTGSRREGVALAGGIVTVNMIWAGAAVVGASALFRLFPYLYTVVQTLGALYIIWFGIQMLRRARLPLAEAAGAPADGSIARAYRDGFVTAIGNPKAVTFYASVFSTLVPPHVGWPTALAMLGVIGLMGALWYGAVAVALSASHGMRLYRTWKSPIESLCGGLLILFGIRQVLLR